MNKLIMVMYSASVGGAELQFVELANFLAKSSQVRLICLGGAEVIKHSEVNQNIEVKVYPYGRGMFAAIGLLKAFLENLAFKPAIIITTSFIGNVLGFLIGKLNGARLVSLQTVSVCMRHPVIDRYVLRKFDALIAGASDIKDYLLRHGQAQEKVIIVHNWVDFTKRVPTEPVATTKKRYGLEGKLVVGCIGRLHPQKGHEYLIQAFREVTGKHPNASLLIVGDGDIRAHLEDQVLQLGLSDKVIFTGTVLGVEYNNLLQAIDIYVQPSVFEGLPRTILDAMYMGKTIVATDVNGNREAIEHMRNGILVPPCDADALSSAISRLIASDKMQSTLSSEATNTVKEKFEMNTQLEKIRSIVQG